MERVLQKLTDRVNFNFVGTKNKFKTSCFSVNFILPLDAERAHLYSLIPAVLNSGSGKYPTQRDICKRLEELYGADIVVRNFKRGSMQIVGFSLDILASKYTDSEFHMVRKAFDLLYDIILNPKIVEGAFSPDYVAREKRIQIEKIKANINNKSVYVHDMCAYTMCQNEICGIPILGDIDKVEKIEPISLFSAYKYLLNNARVEICFVGEENYNIVYDFAKRFADSLSPSFSNVLGKEKAEIHVVQSVREYYERLDMVQGKLAIGFRIPHAMRENRAVRSVFLHMLGYSPISKLFMNVREKLSLCYYCRLTCDSHSGTMVISSGLENTDFDRATEAILSQIKDISNGDFSDAEFESAKRSAICELKYIYDNIVSIEKWIIVNSAYCEFEDPEELALRIADVKRDDVCSATDSIVTDTIMRFEGTINIDKGEYINE